MSEPRDAGRSAFSLLFRSPLVFSVLCPLSFVATGLFLGLLDPNRAGLWHLLMALQPALWLASVFGVFQELRSLRLDGPVRRSERTALVLCTLLAWFMSSFPFLVQLITRQGALPDDLDVLLQLPHLRAKLLLMGMLQALVATLHTAGMLSVHIQLLAPEAVGLDDEVPRYQRLQRRLARFLVFSAITIGMATLSLGAFHGVLLKVDPSQVFEPSRVLGYGIYYTGLLASVYLPTRKTLTDLGEALAARFVRPVPAEGMSWKDWSQEQEAVRVWLGLRSTALQDLQQGLAVLAPLLASLSALAFGAGG
jgi:hypothetical protein